MRRASRRSSCRPLCESSSYWGYEPAFPFAPRAAYGPAEDPYRLVDEAHARGIGVIMDLPHAASVDLEPQAGRVFCSGVS